MTKQFLFFGAVALIMLVSTCSPLSNDTGTQPTTIDFKIRINYSTDTKAVKQDFVAGDVVYAFFNNVAINETPKYAQFTYNGTNWSGSLQGGLTVAELAASGATMSAVFFPFGTVNITHSDGKYVFTGADGLPIYTYYLSATSDYTLETEGDLATLTATLNMTMPANYVQFFVDKEGDKYNADFTYRLIVHRISPVACASYSLSGSTGTFNEINDVGVGGLDPGQPMWGYAYNNEGIAFSGKINNTTSSYNSSPTWTTTGEHRLIFFELGSPARTKVYSDKTLTGHAAIKLKNVSSWDRAISEPTSKFMGIYKNNDPNTGIQLYWADYNLGASTSLSDSGTEAFGYYFAWGEIVPSEGENSGNWFIKNENGVGWWYWYWNQKYDTAVKNRLDPQDDAANAYLGGDWRMPTAEEFSALWTGATTSQVVSYSSDKRWKITRKVDGNSRTIYLTPAGFKKPSEYSTDHGRYWTASYPKDVFYSPFLNTIEIENLGPGGPGSSGITFWQMPIRPVKEVSVTP